MPASARQVAAATFRVLPAPDVREMRLETGLHVDRRRAVPMSVRVADATPDLPALVGEYGARVTCIALAVGEAVMAESTRKDETFYLEVSTTMPASS